MTRTKTRALANQPNNEVSVLDYGAVGDGVTDDTAAIQEAFNAAAARVGGGGSASIYIPAGTYKISSKIVCTVQYVGQKQSISIYGDGMHASQLMASNQNTDGLLKLTSSGNTETWEVSNLGFVSELTVQDNKLNGTALEIESTLEPGDTGFGSAAPATVALNYINVGAVGSNVVEVNATAGFWENGIVVRNKWYPTLFNCYVRTAEGLSQDHSESRAGILFENTYSPEVNEHYISGAFGYGIKHVNPDGFNGAGTEDFRFNNGFIVGPKYGIYIDHESLTQTLYEPGGTITGNHINAKLTSIYLSRHRQVVISGNYIYVPSTNTFGPGLYPAVHFNNSGDLSFNGNQLLEPGFYNSDSDSSVGVMVSGVSQALIGDNNLFNHGGIGLVFDNTSTSAQAPELYNCRFGEGQGSWQVTKTVLPKTPQSLYSCHISYGNDSSLLTNIVRTVGADLKVDEKYIRYQSNTDEEWTHAETHSIVPNPNDANDFTSNSLTKFWIRSGGAAITALELKGTTCKITGAGSFAVGPDVGVTQNVTISGVTLTIKGGIITNIA